MKRYHVNADFIEQARHAQHKAWTAGDVRRVRLLRRYDTPVIVDRKGCAALPKAGRDYQVPRGRSWDGEDRVTSDELHFANADAAPASLAGWFHDHGVLVFPVHGKAPAVPKGTSWKNYHAADARRLRDFGVPLGTLAVIDTDDDDDERWTQQQIANGAIIDTPFIVETARGRHRYYRLVGPLPKFLYRDGHTIEFKNLGR